MVPKRFCAGFLDSTLRKTSKKNNKKNRMGVITLRGKATSYFL